MFRCPSLKVKKKSGESALSIIRQLKLLDRMSKILVTETEITIPLSRLPSEEELTALRSKLQEFQIKDQTFKRREVKPKNLIEALNEIIPLKLHSAIPRSYDIIGDIAILEIPNDLQDFRVAIGEAVKRLNPHIKTVLAKAGPVSNIFRTREFIILAGRSTTITEHLEHGRIFRLDPRKVYFSPRLSYERQRIVQAVGPEEVIIDMFAGVGPFSIAVASNKQVKRVYGIDLNPEATSYMLQNILLNNLRGRAIAVLADASVPLENFAGLADRVIMNLPAESYRFLTQACRFLRSKGGIVHLYTFASDQISPDKIIERIDIEVEISGRRIVKVEGLRTVKAIAPREWQVAIDIRIA